MQDACGRVGTERVIAILSNYFLKNGNDVRIITTYDPKSYYELDDKIKIYNLYDANKKMNKFKTIIVSLKKMNQILKQEKPDVIVSFLPEPSFKILLFKIFKRKIKVIVSVRNDPNIEYKSKINKVLMKILYPLADGFVFQTEDAKNYFNKKIQSKSVIIPNPIKQEFLNRKKYCGPKENKIVSVGRMSLQKNYNLLLNTCYKMKNDLKDYKIVICGDGSERNNVENQIKKLNLCDKVILLGSVDNVIDVIEKAKMYILTSNYEGMPNALMEALSLGLVCISTDCPCGGPRFLIKNGENGFLIKTNDEEELKNAINNVLQMSNEELNKISNNARLSMREFAEDKINETWNNYVIKIKEKIY